MGYTQRDRQLLLARALVAYLEEGHELDWTERSWRADPALSQGEESHRIVVKDLRWFDTLVTRLKGDASTRQDR